MEQQQLLDALVEHLGIYHRASVANTESRARETIVKWMIGLNCEQRRAALTIVDAPWIAIVLKMQERLKEGMCTFFLLPDVPTTTQKGLVDPGGDRAAGSRGGKVDSTSYGKGGRLPRLSGQKPSDPVSAGCTGNRATKDISSNLPLPELCFKRAGGLVGRLETGKVSGELLVNSIRLFSSQDGEKKATYCCSDTASLDCLTVTEDFVANIEMFLEVMDDLTNHEFLNTPCLSAATPWEEMPWLQSWGYYSLPAFIANKLEFALWLAWNRTQGSKRPLKSLGLQSFKPQRMTANSSSSSPSGNTAAAATVFGRNQGCMDWWSKLGSKERTKLVTCTVALATKSEVFDVLADFKPVGGNVIGAEARDQAKVVSRNLGDARGTIVRRRSFPNLDICKFAKPGENEAAVSPYVPGLRALKGLSESGFLCGKFEGMNSMQEDDGRWLFDSTLKSVHSLADRVRRKVRNALVKVRNDLVELELLGDESSAKIHKANGTDRSGIKVTKAKKKRRKSAISSKTSVPQIAEAAKLAGHSSPKGETLKEDQSASRPSELEVQVRSPDNNQAVSEAQSIAGGRQVHGRKGKGGRGKMNVKSQQPMLLENSLMKDEDVFRHSNTSCSTVSDDLGTFLNNRDGAPSSGDSPSYKVQTVHDSSKQYPSRSAIHLEKEYPCDTEASLFGSLDSPSDKKTINNTVVHVVPAAHLIPAVVTSSSSGVDVCEEHDLQGEHLSCAQKVVQVQDCARSTSDMSSSRKTENGHSGVPNNFDTSVAICEASNVPIMKGHPSAFEQASTDSPSICVGTIDIALPELQRSTGNASGHARSPLNRMASRHGNDDGCVSKSDRAGCHVVQDTLNEMPPEADKRGLKEGIVGVPHGDGKLGPQSFSGLSRFTKASRQLDYTSSRHSHLQRGTALRPVPHEWPGSPQYGYFGAYHQPTATEWLQLDVGQGWPQRMESPLLTYRSTPILRQQQTGQAERPALRTVASWTSNARNVEIAPAVQPTYNISPAGTYSVTSNEDSRLSVRPLFNPSPLSSGYPEIDVSGQGRTYHELESDDRLTYDTDGDDYGIYRSGEFDDLDGYLISEEEVERYAEDIAESNSADYHEIFGGGVMYWNAADYTGQGYSRPGSLSSDDSSWARHEADLSAVLDDIVNYQPLQASYSGKGHASSAVPSCSPSPPSSSSAPLNFEHLSPMASSNQRHCKPRPTGMEFPGKFVQLSNQGVTAEDKSVSSRVPVTLEVIEQISSENSAPAMLRPLVVVRDLSLARQSSTSDVSRLQEAKSPHMVTRSRRDIPGHRMRPPSPVSRCVPPPAPPPPPPSPVAGPKRRKGFMAARSGSSSPRHWGFLNWQRDESEFWEGPEGPSGLRRGCITGTSTVHSVSGALLRERLVAIPPLSLEQEHPDVSIPMKTTLLHNSNPASHPGLAKLLSALHVEIEAFSWQVGTENKLRKPFINVAEKKVAHSLQVLWPRSRVKIFGSVATGLALPTSDVDLVVCLPPVRNLEPIKEAGILEGRNGIKETSLQHAARYLADQDWVKNDSMKIIENTAVPVIMMVAEFLPHQCEMGDDDAPSFLAPNIRKETCGGSTKGESRTAEHASTTVRSDGVSNLPVEGTTGPWGGRAARQLVHLDISFETPFHNGLRTAELVRELVGLYPALSPLALVLKQFLTDRSLDRPYTGGLSSYCLVLLITRFLQHQQHQGKPSSNQNLGRLFMDFLHFFGCVFDPRRMGVRIRGGGMYVSRDRYNNIDPLYIEDPLYPENNVGRNCFRVLQCVKAFADGYAVLENKLQGTSTDTLDPGMGVDSLELLQLMLPCIMTK